MKILFINIALRPQSDLKLMPVGLAYVMTAVQNAGYKFELLDINYHRYSDDYVRRYLETNRFDVVCMGCIVTGYKYVKWLSNIIKNAFPQTIVVIGNTVGSSIPHIIFQKTPADIIVYGEGEVTTVDLLRCLETSGDMSEVNGIYYRNVSGEIIKNPPRDPIIPIDGIPFPNWGLFDDVEAYIESASRYTINEPYPLPPEMVRAIPVSTSRGCTHKCTFCFNAFKDVPYRHRSPQSLVDEINHWKDLYNINYILFHDDLTFYSKSQADLFMDCFIKSDIDVYWSADCRSGLFSSEDDLKLAEKFKQAGCVGLGYSLESTDPEILNMMNKRATPEQFKHQAKILDRAGIATWTSIIIGYPSETEETIRATIKFCAECGVYPSVGYLLPQPGTPMYEYAIKNGHIVDEEEYILAMGDRQDLRLNITKLSDEKLTGTVIECLEECSRELGINLSSDRLIKTGSYKSKK